MDSVYLLPPLDFGFGKSKQYVEVWINGQKRNHLKVCDSWKKLGITQGDFARGILKTIELWPSVRLPDGFKPLFEIMREVSLHFEPIDENALDAFISLDSETVIMYEAEKITVFIPLETFVIECLAWLSARPNGLCIGKSNLAFAEWFKKKWYEVLERVRPKPLTSAIPR